MKKIKAFTLIELLVVVVIIGILATFVVVALGGYQKRTRETKRKNDVQQVYTALQSFVTGGTVIPVGATTINNSNYGNFKGPDGKSYLSQAPFDNNEYYVHYNGDGTGGFEVWATSVYNSQDDSSDTIAPNRTCWYMGTGASNIQKNSLDATADKCSVDGGPTVSGVM